MSAVLSANARTILEKRYFHNGENEEGLFKRVSLGNEKYFELMSNLLFMPNSPTLFNAGLNNGCTLSACFVFDFDDTMFDSSRSIVNTRAKAIAVAKAGGGVGYYGGNLRPRNSVIKSIHRKACGPIGVLKDMHGVRQLITQGGKRDLAQLWAQPSWHPDCSEIIDCKNDDPKSLESFNISISWNDETIGEAFDNKDSKYGKLWDQQCRAAWKTGCPGMLFYDTINRANPNIETVGLINATNPCGETPNRSDEPCNLGSLSLRRMVTKNREVNWNLLEEVTYLSTLFLDDILDANTFPHPDITAAALATRKLGLGAMGWADMLALLHIHYGSEESFALGDKIGAFIAAVNLQARKDNVKKKGRPYGAYDETKTNGPCLRNETGISYAPTGTIAIIVEDSSSIEPHFALETDRVTNEGIRMKQRISVWNELDGFVPKTAHEVTIEEHIKMQAVFQKHTDLGVSKTINLPHSATVEDVSKAYRMMYELGCKGGTIYRDGCREEQVLRATHKPGKSVYSLPSISDVFEITQEEEKETKTVERIHLDDDRDSKTHKFRVGEAKGYLTVGLTPDGKPIEIFLNISKVGSTISGLLNIWSITFSVGLQHGIPLEALCHSLIGTRFEPSGMTRNKKIPVASSITDYVCRYLINRFIPKPTNGKHNRLDMVKSGQLCPECGKETIYQSGCLTCVEPGCNWSRCG